MSAFGPSNFRAACLAAACLAALFGQAPSAARAQPCGHSAAGFSAWLAGFQKVARAKGISAGTVDAAFGGLGYFRRAVHLDRSQRSFKLSYRQFYRRRVSRSMLVKGRRLMRRHRDLFQRIRKRYGVPPEVLVAIWGLETNFGRDSGSFPIVRSLATLAYDCRRSRFFRNELIAALRIIDRGDMRASQMRGGWAGEIGPMQFLASSYERYAVDFDGNGRRDLIRSIPDALASTANYLRAKGWRRGQGWGPGSGNYDVLREWNKASVYVRTIAAVASKLGGAPG
jgi:lytic murein transglycosylase